jgi:RNA polymerase sigma-70 factor (ECF subfamily)
MQVVKSEVLVSEEGGQPPATPGAGALVAAARAGDRRAMGELYQQHRRLVHGLALAQLPPADVDDLVQEVFLQAMRKLDSLREVEAFGPWLATIARHSIANRHRARRLRAETSDADLPEATDGVGGGGRASAEARATAAEILALIHQLPLPYREPLVLRLVEGMTGPEIAERTGLAPASVRVNLHRGMTKLRELLQARGEDRP